MKQLLSSCSYGNTSSGRVAVVVALNDCAFLVVSHGGETDIIVELLAPPSSTPARTEKSKTVNATVTVNVQEIQAVAADTTNDSTIVWCAVSRLNKSVCLYRVDTTAYNATDTASDASDDNIPSVTPTTFYQRPKRVVCLGFARVPLSPNADTTPKDKKVLLTGDLTGDAWALPLEKGPPKPRLLLGHTASMLTGIQVHHNILLTADRDEKIRVSSFPQTTIIQNFLLGHSAYISALDVATAFGQTICVSCSGGDGTVRLWDFRAKKELSCWSANNNTNDIDNEKDKEQPVPPRIPSRVAIHPDGTFVAVIYDQCNTLDILQVHQKQEQGNNSHQSRLTPVQSMECTDQPLAVTFLKNRVTTTLLVTLKDPSYLQVYQQIQSDNYSTDNAPNAVFQPIDTPWTTRLVAYATSLQLTMPDSVLEKDKQGQPRMRKNVERRGGSSAAGAAVGGMEEMPWNNPKRIIIAKERNKRHKKRKQEEKNANAIANANANNDNGSGNNDNEEES